MQRYFINEEEYMTKTLMGEKYHHIANVMRNKINEEIELCLDERTYLSKITSITNKKVEFEIIKELEKNTEMDIKVTIIQGYPKSDKMDLIVQKSVELGVYSIIPVIMNRSVVKLDNARAKSKKERLQKISLEAAMQCGRNIVPCIQDITSLKEINYTKYDIIIVAYEEDAKNDVNNNFMRLIKSITPGCKIAIVIGPEGGISDEEIVLLKNNGAITTSLGKRILRTETAPLYVLSAIGYERG